MLSTRATPTSASSSPAAQEPTAAAKSRSSPSRSRASAAAQPRPSVARSSQDHRDGAVAGGRTGVHTVPQGNCETTSWPASGGFLASGLESSRWMCPLEKREELGELVHLAAIQWGGARSGVSPVCPCPSEKQQQQRACLSPNPNQRSRARRADAGPECICSWVKRPVSSATHMENPSFSAESPEGPAAPAPGPEAPSSGPAPARAQTAPSPTDAGRGLQGRAGTGRAPVQVGGVGVGGHRSWGASAGQAPGWPPSGQESRG